jgi:cell division protein FtsL
MQGDSSREYLAGGATSRIRSDGYPAAAGTRPDFETAIRPGTSAHTKAVKKFAVLIMIVLAGFALCMLYTYQATRTITMGYQIDNLQSGIAKLQATNGQLQLQVAELQAPERIEQVATTKLGMQEPQDFLVEASTAGQVSGQESRSSGLSQGGSNAPALADGAGAVPGGHPASSWSARLLAAIPKFVGRAEAAPNTQ